MKSKTVITAYGSPNDREKLVFLASASHKSLSKWIIMMIRREYKNSFQQ